MGVLDIYNYIIKNRKRNHKYIKTKINVFSDYKEKIYGCITYNNDHHHIDIYVSFLKNTPLIFILDINLKKNIEIPAMIYIDKNINVTVRIIKTIDNRSIITILNNNDILILNESDVYINIKYQNNITDNIKKTKTEKIELPLNKKIEKIDLQLIKIKNEK